MSGSPSGPRQYRALAQLAGKHRKIGHRAAEARDQVTAIREYRAALELIQQIAAIEPADHDVLRQLAAEYHHEGYFAAVMGYAVVVRYEYRAELILLERLSRDRPGDQGLLRARADAHHELARRAQFDGDNETLKREQQAEVAIMRQLALADPETGALLREAEGERAQAGPVPADAGRADTGTAGAGTADTGTAGAGTAGAGTADTGTAGAGTAQAGDAGTLAAEEQIETLKALVERATTADDAVTVRAGLQALILVRERIAAARPGDAGALRELALAHRDLGRRWQADGDPEAARRAHEAEVAVMRQAALADPRTGDLLREVMAKPGAGAAEPGEAGPDGEPGQAVPEAGRPAGPAVEPADDGARSRDLTELAQRANSAGDRETEQASLTALVALRQRQAAARPGEVQPQLDLAGAHRGLAGFLAGTGQAEAAHRSSLAEVAVLALLAAARPADTDRLNALASAYGRLAGHAHIASQHAEARAACQAEILIRGWLVAAQPVSWRQDALDQAQYRLSSLPNPSPPSGLLNR